MKQIFFLVTSSGKFYQRALFFGGIATVLLLGSFSYTFADDTIVVRGQVGSVIAGPSGEDTSDNGSDNDRDNNSDKKKNPASPVAQATVSIEAVDRQGMVANTAGGVPQFTASRPSFRGTTNIQNANITLVFSFGVFSLRSTFKANADGTWTWTSPEAFPNGNFRVTATAIHPTEASIRAEATLQFFVLAPKTDTPWNEQYPNTSVTSLFDLLVEIKEAYKTITPGENLIASVHLINFNSTETLENVLVSYSILDEEGNEILHQQETVVAGTKLSYFKVFYTQPDMKTGTYTLVVKVPSRNMLAVSSDQFTVEGKRELYITSLAKIDYTAIFLVITAIFFTFILLSYFEFIRFLSVKKRIRMVSSKFLKRFF